MYNEILLDDLINEILKNLKNLKTGSDERSEAIAELTKLYKLKLEIETESEDRRGKVSKEEFDKEKFDKEMKFTKEKFDKEMKFTKFSENLKIGVSIAGVVLPLVFYATWMNKGFKFEETGVYTSSTFKGLFSRFKPTSV